MIEKDFNIFYEQMEYISFLNIVKTKNEVDEDVAEKVYILTSKIYNDSYIFDFSLVELWKLIGKASLYYYLKIKLNKIKKIIFGKVKFDNLYGYFKWFKKNLFLINNGDNIDFINYIDYKVTLSLYKQIQYKIKSPNKDIAEAKLIEKVWDCLPSTSLNVELKNHILNLKNENKVKIEKLKFECPEFYLKNKNCYQFLAESLHFNFGLRLKTEIGLYSGKIIGIII
jgi:hypothetical protein